MFVFHFIKTTFRERLYLCHQDNNRVCVCARACYYQPLYGVAAALWKEKTRQEAAQWEEEQQICRLSRRWRCSAKQPAAEGTRTGLWRVSDCVAWHFPSTWAAGWETRASNAVCCLTATHFTPHSHMRADGRCVSVRWKDCVTFDRRVVM